MPTGKKLFFTEGDFTHVVTLVGKIPAVGGVKGFPNKETKEGEAAADAAADADDRNTQAIDMGIKARYEVVEVS